MEIDYTSILPTSGSGVFTSFASVAVSAAVSPRRDYRLIIFRDNYADEFEMEGFAVMTRWVADEFFDTIRRAYYPYAWGFGTNEECEWDTVDELQRCFTSSEITAEQAINLIALMQGSQPTYMPNVYTFGHFPRIEADDEEDESTDESDDGNDDEDNNWGIDGEMLDNDPGDWV